MYKNKKYKVGYKFGKLTIIELLIIHDKRTKFLCECDCGKQIKLSNNNISHKLDCGCSSRRRKVKDLTGHKNGKLTIIKWLKSNNGQNIWECLCECGQLFEISTYGFNTKFKDCPKCRLDRANTNIYEDIPRFLFTRMKGNAKTRKLEFNITKEFLWELFLKQQKKCALSGQKIVFSKKSIDTTASLDRIDSSKGYNIDNVQWVHKDVNMIKQCYNQTVFIKFCSDIAENLNKSKFDKNSSWHQYYFDLLEVISQKSKDPSTKVGCVIVGEDNEIRSTGFNSAPRLVNDNLLNRYQYPLKKIYVEHAERNAIYNAARIGVSLKDCIIYISFLPCSECARAIIQVGIKRIIYQQKKQDVLTERYKKDSPEWYKNLPIAIEMLNEAKVEVIGI